MNKKEEAIISRVFYALRQLLIINMYTEFNR